MYIEKIHPRSFGCITASNAQVIHVESLERHSLYLWVWVICMFQIGQVGRAVYESRSISLTQHLRSYKDSRQHFLHIYTHLTGSGPDEEAK